MSVVAEVGVFVGWRMDRDATGADADALDALMDQPDGSTAIRFPAMGDPAVAPATFVGRWIARWDNEAPVLVPLHGVSLPGKPPARPAFGDGWRFGAWFVADWT